MQTLSLCMIVKDEAGNLPRSLAPLLPYVDEAVVVDTGSTDGTPAGAPWGRVQFAWSHDFAARNFWTRARGWIMWLDEITACPRRAPSQSWCVTERRLWATGLSSRGAFSSSASFPASGDPLPLPGARQLCHPSLARSSPSAHLSLGLNKISPAKAGGLISGRSPGAPQDFISVST
jgi:hypothetical protein